MLIRSTNVAFADNVWRLGVCYFALQTFQVLDKIYRQNNSTKPLLCAGRFISTKFNLKTK